MMISSLIIALAYVLNYALEIYMWAVIIAAILSWVNPDPYNPIVRFLRSVTEPALRPIRRMIGYRLGPVDISPMVVILIIIFIQKFVVSLMFEFAYKMKGGAFL